MGSSGSRPRSSRHPWMSAAAVMTESDVPEAFMAAMGPGTCECET